MTTRKSMSGTLVSAFLASMFLIGCGAEKPESILASAKDYMAKNDNKAAVIQLKNALQNNPNLAEARFLLGKALFESGNPSAAEVELRKAIEFKYPEDQVIPLLAQTLLAQGQPKKIIDDLAKMQLSSPESKAGFQTTLGQAFLMTGKLESAQVAFNEAIATIPDYGPAIIGQARIKAGKSDLPGALTLLDRAIEKTPRLYTAWQLKGEILSAQGNSKASSEAFLKALEIKPDYLPTHSSLISRSIESENFEEAGKQLDAMKKIAPAHPQTSYLQAMLSYRQKNFKSAQEAIQLHLKSAPNSVLGLQLAGAIEYELKSYSMAETHLLKALPNTPELGMARRILIASYLRGGQPEKALAMLQPVLDKIEKNSGMLELAGEVYMQNGDANKAGIYFAKAAALDPENTRKRTSVAISHLAKGETETAYRELEQIASSDTGIKADMTLIASQLKSKKFDQALKSVAVLEKKQPESPLAHTLRGSAFLGKGDGAAARKSFELALLKNPAYFPAAASLANMDMVDKKPEDAKKRLEGVVAKDPKNVPALLALAELRAKAGGKPDEVVALINKAVAANPDEPTPRLALIGFYLSAKEAKKAVAAAQDALGILPVSPEILDAAGRAQQAAEDFNQALATYGKLAGLVPNSVHPYLRMAEIHVAAKNKDAAMQTLRKALVIKPDSIEAQRGIMMLDIDAGRIPQALETARNVQKQNPKSPVGFMLEGDVHALKKSWNEAAAVYRKGIAQTGATELAIKLHAALTAVGGNDAGKFAESWMKDHAKDEKFGMYLADSANARKDFVLASKYYRVLLDTQPNNPMILNNLAWSLAQIKDPKAVDYAEKAYKLAPDQPAIMDTLGWLLVEKGEMVRGMSLLQKATSLAPQNALIKFNFAKALVKSGKKSEAKKELEELAKLGEKFPAQAEVTKLLQSL